MKAGRHAIRAVRAPSLAVRALLVGLALAAGLAGGLPGPGRGSRAGNRPADSRGPRRMPARPCRPGAAGDARAEPGAYASDDRVAPLLAAWPAEVLAGLRPHDPRHGLAFRPGAEPSVVLAPLGDEALDWRITTGILAGSRRPVVRVNLEPLAAGRLDVARVLPAALAAAAFEDRPAFRTERAPAWVARLASLVAGEGLEPALRALSRRAAASGPTAVRVDPRDDAAADATAVPRSSWWCRKAPRRTWAVSSRSPSRATTRGLPRPARRGPRRGMGGRRTAPARAAPRRPRHGALDVVARAREALTETGPRVWRPSSPRASRP